MNRDSGYFKQAELMLRTIPFVAREDCFALKGGTAINFFLRNMPRLSVDIDLVYLPIESRDISLDKMSRALKRIAVAIRKENKELSVQEKKGAGNRTTKIFVKTRDHQITIEPNEVIRGTVFHTEERTTAEKVENTFRLSATINVVAMSDLYGGKLCAALDRQHPRDVFDMKLLLENEGITADIRRAFLVYLAGHDRPIHELINPSRQDMRPAYDNAFVGMTIEMVPYEALLEVREQYTSYVKEMFTTDERRFLISLKEGSPDWNLLGLKDAENLPAIQWKLKNIQTLKAKNPSKHAVLLKKLQESLGV